MSEHDLPPPPPPAGDPPPAPAPVPAAELTAAPAAAAAPAPVSIRQTSVLAIVSLVSGLLGLTLVPLFGSLVAIITGHMARAEIAREPDTKEGDALAITGLVLGWAVVVMSVLTVLAIVLVFGGLAALLAAIGLGSQY